MLTFLAFIIAAQFGAERAPDLAGVQSRIGAIEAAASALADRTHNLRKALPSTPPAIIERADLVAPGKLRIYASPIRYEKNGTYLPIQLAWQPGNDALFVCTTNTMETAIAVDGWKQVSGKGWSLSTRPTTATGKIQVRRTDADVLEVSGLWPDGAVTQYELRRGGVKETIVLERAPESTVWTYDTKLDGTTRLELSEGGAECHIVAESGVVAILPLPVAIDAKGQELTGTYSLDGSALSVVFADEWFASAAYPVRVDPTASVDTTLGVSIRDGTDYQRALLKFPLPELSSAVTAAVLHCHGQENAITAPDTVTVHAYTTPTSDWTSGTSAATMDAYTYTASLDSNAFSDASGLTWYEWDVLGSEGTESAIADAYADNDDPCDWTVKLSIGSAGSTVAAVTTVIQFGPDSGSSFKFDGPSDVDNPYLEITYDASATATYRGSGSVGIVGL